MLKKLINFIKDIFFQKKNLFYINKDSSYQLFRTMERISNGLFASFLSILITKRKIKNTKNSYQLLDDIPDYEINNLSKAVKKMKVYNKTEIKKINNHDLNMNVDKYSYDLNQNYTSKAVRLDILKDELLSNVEVAKFALNEKWINVIKKIYHIEPKLIDVTAWYTFPNNKTNEYESEEKTSYDAQIWHRDVDRLADIKIFTYLSDVYDIDDGPFEILNTTHSFNLLKLKYLNKNNFRVLEKDIPLKLKNKQISFLGKRGTNFMVNTRCLHRGKKIKNNHRLILELYFSNSFFGKHYQYNKFTRPNLSERWDSYPNWKEKIDKFPNTYKYIFLGTH